MLVIDFGRFGLLLREIGERIGADITMLSAPWGETVPIDQIAAAIERIGPDIVACVHGDTSTTMAQPLDGLGALCRAAGALSYVDATRSLGHRHRHRRAAEMPGRPFRLVADHHFGSRPAEHIFARRHVEKGIARPDLVNSNGPRILSNYFDLAMVMDYWSEKRLNHHTEATTMLYGARECARVALGEGLEARFARHAAAGRAVTAGARAMGLAVFGDDAHRMTTSPRSIFRMASTARRSACACARISRSRSAPPSPAGGQGVADRGDGLQCDEA